MNTNRVSDTLTVETCLGRDPHAVVARERGGLVRVEPHELRKLVQDLCTAAGELAQDAARGTYRGHYCEGCGMALAVGDPPYHLDVGHTIYLCESCAQIDDADDAGAFDAGGTGLPRRAYRLGDEDLSDQTANL